jgi:hypothetical protein
MSAKWEKTIYLAGPYTAKDSKGNWDWSAVTSNIRRAEIAAAKLWKKGWGSKVL